MSALHVLGLAATIALIVGVGVWSGKKVRSAEDFSGGSGKVGPWIVCGAIMALGLLRGRSAGEEKTG